MDYYYYHDSEKKGNLLNRDNINGEDAESWCGLESLNLSLNDLSAVSPGAIARLHTVLRVNLAGTKLQHDQVHSLLRGMMSGSHPMSGSEESRLRHLILADVNLSSVNQELLASGCGRLSSLNLKVAMIEVFHHSFSFCFSEHRAQSVSSDPAPDPGNSS